MAFQNWVAFDRISAPDVRAREHLTCPLLWCRHRFENLASCLQHVSVCPWLSNAYYWCPQCRRVERFTPNDSASRLPHLTSVDRKNSKLRRAITFFKHFGRKASNHGLIPEARPTPPKDDAASNHRSYYTCLQEKTSLASSNKLGITDEPQSFSTGSGLSTASSIGLFDFGFSADDQPNTLFDMEGNALSPFVGVDTRALDSNTPELASSDPLFNSSQLGDTSVFAPYSESHMEAHDCNSQYLPSAYGPFSLSMCTGETQCPYDPMVLGDESRASIEAEDWARADPVTALDLCTTDSTKTCNLPTPQGDILAEFKSMECLKYSSEPCSSETAKAIAPSTAQAYPTGHRKPVASKEIKIRDLQELVCGLHGHWLQDIRSTPGFPFVRTTICGLTPFEAGIRSLQQCFRGTPPTTLEGVLSLMHFAFACAYALEYDLESPCWHSLFIDALDWRSKIPVKEDRCMYVRIACLLWAPKEGFLWPEPATTSSRSEDWNDSVNQTLDVADANTGELIDRNTSTEIDRVGSLPLSMLEATSLEHKGTGAVLQICSRYLNGTSKLLQPSVDTSDSVPWYP